MLETASSLRAKIISATCSAVSLVSKIWHIVVAQQILVKLKGERKMGL